MVILQRTAGRAEIRRHLDACEVVMVMGVPTTIYHPDYAVCRMTRPALCPWHDCREIWPPEWRAGSQAVAEVEGTAELETLVRTACSVPLPVRRYSPCARPFAVVVSEGGRGWLFLEGRAVRRVRVPMDPPWNGYHFFPEGALGIPKGSAGMGARDTGLGILVLEAPKNGGKLAAMEFLATVVHEQFHAGFQEVPSEDVSPLLRLDPGLEERWDPDRWRVFLENRYDTEQCFRDALAEETDHLARIRAALLAGRRSEVSGEMSQFFRVRGSRRSGMSREAAVYEKYWEYLEGTAQFVELTAVREVYGVDRFPSDGGGSDQLDSSYFLTTGALMADVVWLLSPAVFHATVEPGRVGDLETALVRAVSPA